MTHQSRGHDQQSSQRCIICTLFQSMAKRQYRSSYDREMYLHHLQIAHGVKLPEEELGARKQGGVLKE